MVRKMFSIIGIVWVLVSITSSPANASVTLKEVKSIYKALIKKNKLDAPPLYVVKNNDINGFTLKDKIVITTGAMKYLDKAEMALILGHELTHWKFNDAYSWFEVGTFMEDRADVFGAEYAKNIGYPKCQQAQLFILFHYLYGEHEGHHSLNPVRYHNICNA